MKEIKKISGSICSFAGILSVIILTFFDQFTKYLAVTYLKDHEPMVLISHILELKYLENKGIAFGMLQGKIVLFLTVCILFLAAALYAYIRIPKTNYYLPLMLTGFLIISGAVGNSIDRFFRGYVVDFIYVSWIDFPIFNVADIYVVCGGILLVILAAFYYKDDDFTFLSLKKRG